MTHLMLATALANPKPTGAQSSETPNAAVDGDAETSFSNVVDAAKAEANQNEADTEVDLEVDELLPDDVDAEEILADEDNSDPDFTAQLQPDDTDLVDEPQPETGTDFSLDAQKPDAVPVDNAADKPVLPTNLLANVAAPVLPADKPATSQKQADSIPATKILAPTPEATTVSARLHAQGEALSKPTIQAPANAQSTTQPLTDEDAIEPALSQKQLRSTVDATQSQLKTGTVPAQNVTATSVAEQLQIGEQVKLTAQEGKQQAETELRFRAELPLETRRANNAYVQTAPVAVANAAAVQNTAYAQTLLQSRAVADVAKTDLSAVVDAEMSTFQSELRATTQSGTQVTAPLSNAGQTALARHVSAQITEAMRNTAERPVEIALNPAELGRVRMTIGVADGAVTLHILAERPETLDLMRRNMDTLTREVAELGFTSIDLAFGQGTQTGSDEAANDNQNTEQHSALIDIEQLAPETPHRIVRLDGSTGVDIRV